MIKNFTDLAANERTYLAWIRTAIALMTFGFFVEKFDLFLRMISHGLHVYTHGSPNLAGSAEIIGITLMILAVIVMLIATIKYAINRKHILATTTQTYNKYRLDLVMASFLIVLSVILIVYICLSILY